MTEYDYWLDRGIGYEQWLVSRPQEVYRRQEKLIREVLSKIKFDSVLEIGCGYGRITEIVNSFLPSRYTAIDISENQISHARARLPSVEFVRSSVEDFESSETWDLVLAVEVLMHIPPDRIKGVTQSMIRWSSRYVMNLDFSTPGVSYPHNWGHDYVSLYSPHSMRVLPVNELQTLFLIEKGEM